VKLSDDEIEEAFTRSATVVQRYFRGSAVLWAFCLIESPIRVPEMPSNFIRTHNETLSVVAVRVRNPHCSPVGINR
jgi:hypothetical protein